MARKKSTRKKIARRWCRSVTADSLYQQALHARSAAESFDLVQQALERDPFHVPATTLLIDLCPIPKTAIELAQDNVANARRQLGQATIEQYAGRLREREDAEPFLYACQQFAELLVEHGELDRAVPLLQELVQLDPGDPGHFRVDLLNTLVRLARWDEAEALLKDYPDDPTAGFRFTAVLAAMRRSGVTDEVQELLGRAHQQNPHVVSQLVAGMPQEELPGTAMVPGGPAEAQAYVSMFLSVWKSVPGVMTWLRMAASELGIEEPSETVDYEREIQRLRRRIKRLPIDDELVWFCFLTREPQTGLTAMFVATQDAELCYQNVLSETDPKRQRMEILLGLMLAMDEPETGYPDRPGLLVFVDESLRKSVRKRLEALDLETDVTDDPPPFIRSILKASESSMDDSTPLSDVPQSPGEVWQVDWLQLPFWIPHHDTGESIQPWASLVLSVTREIILAQDVRDELPDREAVEALLSRAIRSPMIDQPARPQTVIVRSAEERLLASPLLDSVSVKCQVGPMEELDRLVAKMTASMAPDESPIAPLTDTDGISIAQVGEFYEAAVAFYRAAVWNFVPSSHFVSVRCPDVIHGRWYAVIMGQMGMECGLMLFDDLDNLTALFDRPNEGSEASAGLMHGIGFSFGDKHFLSPRDVAACDQFGWPVAGPEAWPNVYFVDRGRPRSVKPDELDLAIVATAMLPEFFKSRQHRMTCETELRGRAVQVEFETCD